MTKKILFFITKSNWGGAQKQVFDIAVNLNKDDFAPSVFCGGEGLLINKLKENNIRTIPLKNLGRDIKILSEIKSLIDIIKIIKKESPDIIHLHSPKAAGLGSVAGRIFGIKKIIYTSHGWSFNEDRNIFQKTLIKIFSWLTIIFSHKTIVLSQKEFDQVKNWPWTKNKLIIIPNGIKKGNYLTKSEAREKISNLIDKKIQENVFVVGTIAELHKNKGLSYAVEALSKIKNILYVIIGEGEERINIEKQIKNLGAENIFLAGSIPSASSLLKAFDVFLLASVKEGLPYVLLEAGDAMIPIVSTNVGGISGLITTMESGILIDPKNGEAVIKNILYILENPYKSSLFAENLNKKIIENNSFEKTFEELLVIYN